jgi:hypothetical protein
LRLRLPAAPLLGILPFPLFSFPAGLLSGIFISADRSRWLFLSPVVVLLLLVRPVLFRLRLGSPSVPVLRNCLVFLLGLCASHSPFPPGGVQGLPCAGVRGDGGQGCLAGGTWERTVHGSGGGNWRVWALWRWVPCVGIHWIVRFSCLGVMGDRRGGWRWRSFFGAVSLSNLFLLSSSPFVR